MQISLRSQPTKSRLPPAVSSKTYVDPDERIVAASSSTSSLTRRLTRKFKRSTPSNESDSSTCSTPVPSKSGHFGSKTSLSSDESPSQSSMSSPIQSRRNSSGGGPLTQVRSGCSSASVNSSGSAYDYGYGSGCYTVNLEHMYPRKQSTLVLPMDVLVNDGGFYNIEPEEKEIITRGLKKFSAQDYLALL